MANDVVVAVDVEHSTVGTGPRHILPRQIRDDLWRPDGFQEVGSEPPTLVAIQDRYAITHRFRQAPPRWKVIAIRQDAGFCSSHSQDHYGPVQSNTVTAIPNEKRTWSDLEA